MPVIVVVEHSEDWPLNLPGVEVVEAGSYLTDPGFSARRGLKVFNLCRSYRYQSAGYYVSLLAMARGHKPLPSVATIQDLKSPAIVRVLSAELEELIQKSLAPLASREFTLSIYFGQNLAKRYQRLALQLFNLFPAPLLRAELARHKGRWQLHKVRPISARHIPEEHREFVLQAAAEYFGRRSGSSTPRTAAPRFDLAILARTDDPQPPSTERTLQRFVRAAEALRIRAEVITRDDYGRLAEFDGLFIRETTQVHHHTYRFARRAAAEGLVVIDDPDSIVRCTNKVFLAELLQRHGLPAPRTWILHRDNLKAMTTELTFPVVLKMPDSSFSQGVVRVADAEELLQNGRKFLASSDLVVAQEFLPTAFDWRVGVLDGQVLFVCRYHMARGHWQIVQRDRPGQNRYGNVETVAAEDAPPALLDLTLRATKLIGDGLYGVDVKEKDGQFFVIEINDNPNIDAGYEDVVLGNGLYERIMKVFLTRMERAREGRSV